MKHWMGIVLAAGLCFCTACGSGGESSQTSQAEAQTAQTTAATAPALESGARVTAVTTMSGNKKSGNRKKLTVPATEPVKAEITSVKLLIGADSLVLDLDEKKENLSSQVVSANNIFTTKDIQIYTEPAGLAEVGDIERNGEQNVHFSLTGKTAGTGKLYLASADGSIVSEPVEFTVRTAEEKEQAERPIYYTPLGDYWHYSEDCAREDYPDATYDWHGNRRGVDRTDVPVMKMPQGRAFGDKTPCPKCAAEE